MSPGRGCGVRMNSVVEPLNAIMGFRNLAVHQYREINLDTVESIPAVGRDDLLYFSELVRRRIDGA